MGSDYPNAPVSCGLHQRAIDSMQPSLDWPTRCHHCEQEIGDEPLVRIETRSGRTCWAHASCQRDYLVRRRADRVVSLVAIVVCVAAAAVVAFTCLPGRR